ncbi:hypothetical protein [Wielerella bovis]|nr:hypothetical protein [Wielerella bovis]
MGTRCPRGSHSWDFAQLFLFSADMHNILIRQPYPDISGSLKAAN